MYFATHVQGIGEHLKWSPFSCENILLAVKQVCLRQYVKEASETTCAIQPKHLKQQRAEPQAGQAGIPSSK